MKRFWLDIEASKVGVLSGISQPWERGRPARPVQLGGYCPSYKQAACDSGVPVRMNMALVGDGYC